MKNIGKGPGVNDEQWINITEEHIKLLRSAVVSWDDCEYGAPCIDPKRPYGNSNVEGDIAELLGWEYDDDAGLTEERSAEARDLHEETALVLQVILAMGEFPTPGRYVAPKYSTAWRRADGSSTAAGGE